MKKILTPFFITAVLVIVVFLLFEDVELFFTKLLEGNKEQIPSFCLLSFLALMADIVLPVPSSIVMFSNGLVLGLAGGLLLSLVSAMAGAWLGYLLGKYTAIGLRSAADEKATLFIRRYGSMAILLSRGVPILSESVSIVCGYNRMAFKSYLSLNLLGYLPVCLIYAYVGSIGANQDVFLFAFGSSIFIAVMFFIFGKRFLKGKLING